MSLLFSAILILLTGSTDSETFKSAWKNLPVSGNISSNDQDPENNALTVTGIADASNVLQPVNGGGTTGQVEAIQLGIAKALATMNEDLRSTLKRADLLGRDPREKERKKFGLKGARKQRQFTKR